MITIKCQSTIIVSSNCCLFQESMSLSSMMPAELECFKVPNIRENADADSDWESDEEYSNAFDVFELDI